MPFTPGLLSLLSFITAFLHAVQVMICLSMLLFISWLLYEMGWVGCCTDSHCWLISIFHFHFWCSGFGVMAAEAVLYFLHALPWVFGHSMLIHLVIMQIAEDLLFSLWVWTPREVLLHLALLSLWQVFCICFHKGADAWCLYSVQTNLSSLCFWVSELFLSLLWGWFHWTHHLFLHMGFDPIIEFGNLG